MFINLDPGQQTNAVGTLKLLQSSFDVIYPSLSKYDGEVCQILMSIADNSVEVVDVFTYLH